MAEYYCKKDLLDIFKKGEIYEVTELNEEYPFIVQVNYINFSLDEDKATNMDSELADYLIVWLRGEWRQMIKDKGSLVNTNGTSSFVMPYLWDYFNIIGLRKKKLEKIERGI